MLKAKSDTSIIASEHLNAGGFYDCSVHCAYYSCVQLAKHILIYKLNKKEETEDQNKSIHTYIINTIQKELKNRQEILTATDFYQNMTQLKLMRITADYKEIKIEVALAIDAIARSKFIIKLLNKHFMS